MPVRHLFLFVALFKIKNIILIVIIKLVGDQMIINKRIYGARIDKLPAQWNFLGAGNNGVVYAIARDKVIKIFREEDTCDKEGDILLRVHGNKYFPKIIELGENYIVREKVEGRNLKDIIQEEGLDENTAHKMVDLLLEFKKLGFTRIDTRLKDIYIDEQGNIRMIDPKGFFTRKMPYPKHLCKGLAKHGGLEKFLSALYEKSPELYMECMTRLFRPEDDDDGKDGIKLQFLKKLKKKKGKIDSYNLHGPDFKVLDGIPIVEELELFEDVNFIDIDEIESLIN